jgi:hypothetical protein
MSLESVSCNQCGTLLHVAPDTRFVTCAHCGTPLAVHRTGTSIFTEAVGEGTPPGPAPLDDVRQQLDEISREQEVARIDREWDREREQYMVTGSAGGSYVDGRHVGGYPVRSVPTKGGSAGMGAVAVIGGLVWMIFVGSMGGGAFALFGVVFIVFGLVMALYTWSKADAYEQAEAAYRRRRAAAGEPADPDNPFERDWQADPPGDPPPGEGDR